MNEHILDFESIKYFIITLYVTIGFLDITIHPFKCFKIIGILIL